VTTARESPLVLGPYPWATPDVRSAVELLTPAQADEFIQLVRAQYRVDHRERAHTVAESDLPGVSGIEGIHDARAARASHGAGGGHKRGADVRADD
jgi:hypothetical protein